MSHLSNKLEEKLYRWIYACARVNELYTELRKAESERDEARDILASTALPDDAAGDEVFSFWVDVQEAGRVDNARLLQICKNKDGRFYVEWRPKRSNEAVNRENDHEG